MIIFQLYNILIGDNNYIMLNNISKIKSSVLYLLKRLGFGSKVESIYGYT